jgi:hypothetical protein
MEIRRRAAHPALRSVVRSFEERRAILESAVLSWPLTARPHQIIDIYLGEPFRLRIDGGPLHSAPRRKGFGHLVLERLAPEGLGGTARLSFEGDGVVWSCETPSYRVVS